MISYKIYTENRKLKWIRSVLNEYFSGYTIYKTEGFWQGKREKSLTIEIICPDDEFRFTELKIQTLCKMLKGYNQQESVLVTSQRVNTLEN